MAAAAMVAAQTAKMITIIDPKTPNLDRTRSGTDPVLDAYSIGVLVRTVNPAQGGAESREIAARTTDLPMVAVGHSAVGRRGPLDPTDRSAPPYRFDLAAVKIVSQTRQINPAGLT